MSNVLIASLGRSPGVVTAALDLLEGAGKPIDRLALLYPAADDWIPFGVDLIRDEWLNRYRQPKDNLDLSGGLEGMSDLDSLPDSWTFLRRSVDILACYFHAGETLYLLAAGGRKNMSALLWAAAQFFPVAGAFHVLDRREREQRREIFKSIEELVALPNPEDRELYLHPGENAQLVQILFLSVHPLYEPLTTFLRGEKTLNELPPEVAEALRASWIVDEGGQLTASGLVTEEMFAPDLPRTTQSLQECLANIHFSDHFSEERPYLEPVCKRIVHKCYPHVEAMRDIRGVGGTYNRVDGVQESAHKPGAWEVVLTLYAHSIPVQFFARTPARNQFQAERIGHRIAQVINSRVNEKTRNVLIAPLGERPGVVTGAMVALRQEMRLHDVVVVYPERHADIAAGARLLKNFVEREGIHYHAVPLSGVEDVDTRQETDRFLDLLVQQARHFRKKGYRLHFSLAGGRKTMGAMTFLAAQLLGAEGVYHILITDPAWEERLEREGFYSMLKAKSSAQQREILFPPAEVLSAVALPALALLSQQIEDGELRAYANLARFAQ